jgi:predicted acyltransferase (DUF342 family)
MDGIQIRNGSNQSIMTVSGNSKATLFEGNITCEGKVSANKLDNVDADGWIKTNSYLEANTIRAYNNGTMVTVNDNLTVSGNLTVTGTTTYTGTVSGIPIGETTQAALDLKANINNPTFLGTVEMNNLDISNAMKCNTVSAYNTGKVTVTDTLSVSGFIEADTICSRIADKVTVNDNLEVIGDLVASGAFLVDTMRTSEANLISIDDNVTISGALVAASSSTTGNVTVGGNLTVSGNLSVLGSLSGYSPYWAACKIDGSVAGAVPTILTRKGDKGSQITCVRKSGQAVGVYEITWTTPHPDGANLICMVSGEGASYSETLGAGSAGFTTTST